MSISLNKPIICPTLIGRQSEVTTLHALIDQARSAQGQVVLISGEAGIGKSRLVAETKTYATEQGFLLLQGNCFPTDRSSPYAPLLDLLRSSQAKELLTTYTANLEPLARDSELWTMAPDGGRTRITAKIDHKAICYILGVFGDHSGTGLNVVVIHLRLPPFRNGLLLGVEVAKLPYTAK